ncbi:LacI family DNA-binding transcriptional regulator [Natronosporangium hydrolyticum]|uniref:LacI family DNA-binding transcriptional regulator n=1 Tax=Natronosporangium hydrolyticum TaxID=2811111 RepID=A0A895Y5Z4_9ACTN|nr:LacI family DNA-binding transcriptional regulator [Natronosporangium hydrolyticum]QSB13144.1 LacI family DNA-binding transcriptional regulator [Natronosporangium hydrolyticum]
MSVVTIHDVARQAGVAVATVSRVMNNTGQVRAETRQRVLSAVTTLGYRPNRTARGMARGRLATVAVLVPFVTHPSAFARVQGMVESCRDLGLPVSLFDVELPEHQGEHLRALAGDLRPEGLVVVSLQLTSDERARLDEAGLRPVLVDTEAAGLSTVCIDDEAGGALATNHLLELGHQRVGFIGDLEHDRFGFTASERRHAGYLRALAEAGLPQRAGYQRTGPHGRETAREHARALLALAEPPTAIFAASDTQALGALEAAREQGLTVPDDLSVIGFDDVEIAEHAGLTTIRQPLVDSGRQAARIVEQERADPGRAAERCVLDITLVARQTTAPPHHSAAAGRRRRAARPVGG